MRILLKIAAGLAVLLVAAVIGVTFALKKYLPPEKVRELITESARKYLHREVRMQSLDLSALKGLAISGLEVSEAPDFGAGTFAKAEGFQLRVRLAPLLHGSVAVDRLAVSGLSLNVKKNADGSFNFSDMAGGAEPASGASPAKGLPLVLDVRQLDIDGGRVDYADAGTGDKVALSGISALVTDLSLTDETKVRLSLKADGKFAQKPVAASLDFLGGVNAARLDLDKASVSVKKADLSIPEGKVSVSGTVKGLESPELDVRVDAALKGMPPASLDVKGGLEGELLTLKSLHLKTAMGTLDASGTVDHLRSNPAPALDVAAKADAPGLSASDLAFLRERGLKIPDGVSIPAFKLDAQAQIKADAATIKSLHASTEGGAIDAVGTVRNWRAAPVPDLTISLKASAPKIMPLASALMKAEGVEVPASLASRSGELDAQFHLAPDAIDIKSLNLTSQGSILQTTGRVAGTSSGKYQASLDVAAKLDLPALTSDDLSPLKAYKFDVPAGLDIPSAKLDAKLHYTPDDVTVSEFRFENKYASAKASGAVHKILSGHPQGTVNGSATLHLPALDSKDLAFLKLAKLEVPASASWPATEADAQFRYDGSDVSFSKLRVKNAILSIDGTGSLKKLATDPTISVSAKTSLPAFTSADAAFVPGMPPDLRIPAAKVELRNLAASRDAVSFDFLKIDSGKNSIEAKGTVKNLKSGVPFFHLTSICPGFVLQDLADLSPLTRELGLKGVGRFKIFIAGEPTKGTAAYTGDLEFRGVGMDLLGFKITDFAGKGTFSESMIDFPPETAIRGGIDDGRLAMDFSVKNYLKKPQIDIQEASLTYLDLGKLLAARESLSKNKPAEEPSAAKPFGIKIYDGLTIDKVVHPNATIDSFSLKCDLSGITPDLKQLDGTASFGTKGGHLVEIDKIAKKYPLFKVLALPILVMRGIGLFPNLSDIPISDIVGDYAIANGVVTVNKFALDGDKLSVSANEGRLDIPGDSQRMDMSVKAGVIPKHVVTCGSISNPNTNCKNIVQRAVDTLETPAKVLENTGESVLPK